MSAARALRHTDEEAEIEVRPTVERDRAAGEAKPLSAYPWDVMTPGETWREVVRPRLERARADRRAAEETYACLRNRAYELVAGRRPKGDIAAWHDLMRRAAALLRDAARDDLACRIEALVELVYMTHVNAGRHDVDAVMRRKHVREILALVAAERSTGGARRADVMGRLRILDANLSRILQVMDAAGLIVRTSHGKETRIDLTPEGRRRAAALAAQPTPAAPAAGTGRQDQHRRGGRATTVSAMPLRPAREKSSRFEPRVGHVEAHATDRAFTAAPATVGGV